MSNAKPFRLTSYSGHHQGGTKEYHVYLFSRRDRKVALLVKRWGKIGAIGQCKVEVVSDGAKALDDVLREKAKSGYDMRNQNGSVQPVDFEHLEDALALLPPVHQRAISNAQLSILDPDTYSGNDRSPFDPLAKDRAKAFQPQVEQAKSSEEDRVLSELKQNPLFGMF